MSDPRVQSLARLLTNHCISVKQGDRVLIQAISVAEPLVLSLLEAVLQAGGHPHLLVYPDRFMEVFARHAHEHQLSFTPTFELMAYTQFESRIWIRADVNTREATNIDPQRDRLWTASYEPVIKAQFEREGKGEFRRVTTMYPTQAYAQDAHMSLGELEEMFFRACHVQNPEDDPVAFWESMAKDHAAILRTLQGHRQVRLQSPDCDLRFSIEGRTFLSASGIVNMPDGEIYTGPVEDSANGRICFTYPSILDGVEVAGVELVFKDGAVVESRAKVGDPTLRQRLQLDEGSTRLGEFGIGTNYGVVTPSGMSLLDEKIGGSIHLALGAGYPETGSSNKSGYHWDLVTDFSHEAEISLDGDVVYRNGKFAL
jgi:aminopeptidase